MMQKYDNYEIPCGTEHGSISSGFDRSSMLELLASDQPEAMDLVTKHFTRNATTIEIVKMSQNLKKVVLDNIKLCLIDQNLVSITFEQDEQLAVLNERKNESETSQKQEQTENEKLRLQYKEINNKVGIYHAFFTI